MNKKKTIEKGNKKLNRLTGDTFSVDYECVGSKCTFICGNEKLGRYLRNASTMGWVLAWRGDMT